MCRSTDGVMMPHVYNDDSSSLVMFFDVESFVSGFEG